MHQPRISDLVHYVTVANGSEHTHSAAIITRVCSPIQYGQSGYVSLIVPADGERLALVPADGQWESFIRVGYCEYGDMDKTWHWPEDTDQATARPQYRRRPLPKEPTPITAYDRAPGSPFTSIEDKMAAVPTYSEKPGAPSVSEATPTFQRPDDEPATS